LGTTLEKHLLKHRFVKELEKLFEHSCISLIVSGDSVALMNKHAVRHISSCLVPRTLVSADGDEVGDNVFAMHVCGEMERCPAF